MRVFFLNVSNQQLIFYYPIAGCLCTKSEPLPQDGFIYDGNKIILFILKNSAVLVA